jgi:tetratricopeptide (TPR) repeat protein
MSAVDDEWSAKSVEALSAGDIGTLSEQLRALPPELLQQAIQTAHELGNRAFKDKAYYEAIDQYTSTLTGDPERVAAWSNRAACFTATKQHDKALRDAEMCVRLKPDWPKAHYRLGRALLGIGGDRTGEAVAAFAKGCGLDPNNAEMQKWHRQAHGAWKDYVTVSGRSAPKPRSFDSQAFDKMVKEHEAEEKVITDAIEQQEAVDNMQFEKPDGSVMSRAEAEAMLTGQDPNAGPRGDKYRASFDTSLLDGVGEADDDGADGDGSGGGEDEFIAAEKFAGAREGFVYTTGSQGLGYYKDMGPAAAAAAGLSSADDVARRKRKATKGDSAAVKALRSYMQDVSELQVPTWQVRQPNS